MKDTVNIFYATDINYLAPLAVSLRSLSENADSQREYRVRVLASGVSDEVLPRLTYGLRENIHVSLHDLGEKIAHIKRELSERLRDYYSESIYYRMFIPSMFPELDRAVYVDCDTVVNADIGTLYDTDTRDCLLCAVSDESVLAEPIFCDYVKRQTGVLTETEYFNSGVLVMNLTAIRAAKIEEKFLHILCKYNLPTVAPDQDYLNFLCRGRVHYLPSGWNKHAIDGRTIPDSELYIMHFNMFNKPWHYENVQNEQLFWRYADSTAYGDELRSGLKNYTDGMRKIDLEGANQLLLSAKEITNSGIGIADVIANGYFELVGLN